MINKIFSTIFITLILTSTQLCASEYEFFSLNKNIEKEVNIVQGNSLIERVFFDYDQNINKKLTLSYETIIANNNSENNVFLDIKRKGDKNGIITSDILEQGYTTEQLVSYYIINNKSLTLKLMVPAHTQKTINFIALKIQD